MNGNDRFHALQELRSLRTYAAITGESVRALIAVPDAVRQTLEAFSAACPEDAAIVDEALAVRDFMLRAL